jgi:cell wall-associated NlpC family hydrolase
MTFQSIIIGKAREYLGTPYHHQGRVKGAGIDCAGLPICVARELNLSNYDVDGYGRDGSGVGLKEAFDFNCIAKSTFDLGDIVLLRIRYHPQHCGIIATDNESNFTLIHACRSRQKVVEVIFGQWWRDRLIACYEFPNIHQL